MMMDRSNGPGGRHAKIHHDMRTTAVQKYLGMESRQVESCGVRSIQPHNIDASSTLLLRVSTDVQTRGLGLCPVAELQSEHKNGMDQIGTFDEPSSKKKIGCQMIGRTY
jgi:hypothetical protein